MPSSALTSLSYVLCALADTLIANPLLSLGIPPSLPTSSSPSFAHTPACSRLLPHEDNVTFPLKVVHHPRQTVKQALTSIHMFIPDFSGASSPKTTLAPSIYSGTFDLYNIDPSAGLRILSSKKQGGYRALPLVGPTSLFLPHLVPTAFVAVASMWAESNVLCTYIKGDLITVYMMWAERRASNGDV
ncbi:hypothetical protein B0H13DRAFT_1864444 [Mycena leptocephala]|nr:hypothetical protein B0H13DRAFT_1864444 [Mycena leptocephala]